MRACYAWDPVGRFQFNNTRIVAGHALALSAMVVAGMNTVGFVITAIIKSHKITDLTVGP